jgi:hypothetical protein
MLVAAVRAILTAVFPCPRPSRQPYVVNRNGGLRYRRPLPSKTVVIRPRLANSSHPTANSWSRIPHPCPEFRFYRRARPPASDRLHLISTLSVGRRAALGTSPPSFGASEVFSHLGRAAEPACCILELRWLTRTLGERNRLQRRTPRFKLAPDRRIPGHLPGPLLRTNSSGCCGLLPSLLILAP